MRYFIYCVCVFTALGCSDESEDGASSFGADNRPALDSGSVGRNTGNIDVQIVEADPVTDAGVDNNGGEPSGVRRLFVSCLQWWKTYKSHKIARVAGGAATENQKRLPKSRLF